MSFPPTFSYILFFCWKNLKVNQLATMSGMHSLQNSSFSFVKESQFSSVAQSCPTLCDPMDYLPPQASISPRSPGGRGHSPAAARGPLCPLGQGLRCPRPCLGSGCPRPAAGAWPGRGRASARRVQPPLQCVPGTSFRGDPWCARPLPPRPGRAPTSSVRSGSGHGRLARSRRALLTPARQQALQRRAAGAEG